MQHCQPVICQCQHCSKASSHFVGIKTKFLAACQHPHDIQWCTMWQNNVASVGKLEDGLNNANIRLGYSQTVEEIFACKALRLIKCILQLATGLNRKQNTVMQNSVSYV